MALHNRSGRQAGSAMALVAVDLGSSNGRVHLGGLDGDRLVVREIHRFWNGPVRIGERWYWDILHILNEVEVGLRRAAEEAGGAPLSIGVDSFGVDYCYLDKGEALMALPRHMRDPRTRGLYGDVYALLSQAALYKRTATAEVEINTLLQLFAERREQPWLQDNAHSLLFAPDFVAWALSGRLVSELTIAATSQLVDPATRDWARDVAERLAIPTHFFNPLVEPGTVIGPVRQPLATSLGLAPGSRVVAVASHDTAAAVVATPLEFDEDRLHQPGDVVAARARDSRAGGLGCGAQGKFHERMRHRQPHHLSQDPDGVVAAPGMPRTLEDRSSGAGLRRHP